jgi:hypothetical protein
VPGLNGGGSAEDGPDGYHHPAQAHQGPGGEFQQTQSSPPKVGPEIRRAAAEMLEAFQTLRQRALAAT